MVTVNAAERQLVIEARVAPNLLARTDSSLWPVPLRPIRLSQDKAVLTAATAYNGLTAEVPLGYLRSHPVPCKGTR
jgi:hypothetical protein